MLFSKNLLKRFITIDDTDQAIQNLLTLKSCEVEGFTSRQIPQEVVIGKVVEVKKHPDADKLWITKVDIGGGKILQIVT